MSDSTWKISDLLPYLENTVDTDRIYIHQCLPSTNDKAKTMAKEGCQHGTVVLANMQTAGRGRFNRVFYSPENTGLYMSIVLDADKLGIEEYSLLTPLVAVITARVIHNITKKKCGIKWVNDLYLEDKKVCGILTEGVLDGNVLNKFVVGIGVNIGTDSFPRELENIAGALIGDAKENDKEEDKNKEWLVKGCAKVRNELASAIINELTSETIFEDYETLMNEYRRNQILLGKEVTVLGAKESYSAKVIDVDDKGHLLVERITEENNGQIETLNSGEVSIKKKSN